MRDFIIPKPLLEFIDKCRGYRCRASYILKCIDYIKENNININEYYENKYDDDRIKEPQRGREMCDR